MQETFRMIDDKHKKGDRQLGTIWEAGRACFIAVLEDGTRLESMTLEMLHQKIINHVRAHHG